MLYLAAIILHTVLYPLHNVEYYVSFMPFMWPPVHKQFKGNTIRVTIEELIKRKLVITEGWNMPIHLLHMHSREIWTEMPCILTPSDTDKSV